MPFATALPSVNTGFGSREVNGQLIPVLEAQTFASGNAVGPHLYGYGSNTPMTIPLTPGSVALGSVQSQGITSAATGFTLTPTRGIVLILMLIVGVAGLRYIHWRG